jgi:hypothetical protein
VQLPGDDHGLRCLVQRLDVPARGPLYGHGLVHPRRGPLRQRLRLRQRDGVRYLLHQRRQLRDGPLLRGARLRRQEGHRQRLHREQSMRERELRDEQVHLSPVDD